MKLYLYLHTMTKKESKKKGKKEKDKQDEMFSNCEESAEKPFSMVRSHLSPPKVSTKLDRWGSLPKIGGDTKDTESRNLHYT